MLLLKTVLACFVVVVAVSGRIEEEEERGRREGGEREECKMTPEPQCPAGHQVIGHISLCRVVATNYSLLTVEGCKERMLYAWQVCVCVCQLIYKERECMYTIAKVSMSGTIQSTIKNRICQYSPTMIEIGASGWLMALVTC